MNDHHVLDAQSQNQISLIEEIDDNASIMPDEFEECGTEDHMQLESIENDRGNVEEAVSECRVVEGLPHVGMQFNSEDEAYDCYNMFAKRKGFSIRKSICKRGSDGQLKSKKYVCSCEGFKDMNDKRKIGRDVVRRKEARTGCQARMVLHRGQDGAWMISDIKDEHNHLLLVSPSKVVTLRSHNKAHLHPAAKSLMDKFHSCGVGPAKMASILNATKGDNDVTITPGQCDSHLRVKRRSNMGRESMSLIQQFIDMQDVDSQFFHRIDIDNDYSLKNIFWADGRARDSYLKFSDVVVFDVTYKTNSFSLPFAPFTGVNHHRQSTLFGCALLADETEETFVWLFETWLKCMCGKAPEAIITDQDPAICNAIKRVFPDTRHRYCIWHIRLHEVEHLRSLRCAYSTSFDELYNKWVKHCKTIEEAEECFIILRDRYKKTFQEPLIEKERSEKNSWRWLESMYSKRYHWIEAYLKDTFFAGMKSSQRSESMNSFFDGFVNSMTPLYEFVGQYGKALIHQRRKEEMEDTMCMKTRPDFSCMHDMEIQAGKFYTRKLFDLFQVEFRDVFYCRHQYMGIEGGFAIYIVTSKINDKLSTHTVKGNQQDETFFCTCAKFETEGLLCKHILYVMKQLFLMESIPNRYLLTRWSLSVRYSTSKKLAMTSSSNETRGKKITPMELWTFCARQASQAKRVIEDRELYEFSLELLDMFENRCARKDAIEETIPANPIISIGSTFSTQQNSIVNNLNIIIRDPERATTKGRPGAATRIKSGIQVSQAQAGVKKRTCSKCGQKGHYMSTCDKSSSLLRDSSGHSRET